MPSQNLYRDRSVSKNKWRKNNVGVKGTLTCPGARGWLDKRKINVEPATRRVEWPAIHGWMWAWLSVLKKLQASTPTLFWDVKRGWNQASKTDAQTQTQRQRLKEKAWKIPRNYGRWHWLAWTFFKDLEAPSEAQLEVGSVLKTTPKSWRCVWYHVHISLGNGRGRVASLGRSPLQFFYLSRWAPDQSGGDRMGVNERIPVIGQDGNEK